MRWRDPPTRDWPLSEEPVVISKRTYYRIIETSPEGVSMQLEWTTSRSHRQWLAENGHRLPDVSQRA